MEIQFVMTYPGLGRIEADQVDALLDALLERLPEVGPVIAQNTAENTLSVATSFDSGSTADLFADEVQRIAAAVRESFEAAGLPWLGVRRAELEPALP